MYRLSILLFAVAAVAGATMAAMHLRGKTPPRPVLATLHGLFAAAGLVVLLLALIKVGFGGTSGIAFGLLTVAALGGFFLLSYHMRGSALPSGLVIGHGLLAVAGFVVLLAAEYALLTS